MFVVLLDPDCNWDLSRRSYWAGGRWLMVDVLVETGLVRKLETFSKWCRVEKRCAQRVTQVITLAGSRLFFVLQ